MGSSPHERQEAIHIVERQLPKSLKLFRGEDSPGLPGGVRVSVGNTERASWDLRSGTAHIIGPAAEAGFVPAQRGDTEANRRHNDRARRSGSTRP